MPLYLDYYYGNEAEQYNFYRIPKLLFTDERFKEVSAEAKVLYGLMLDRMSLSVKNKWLDEFGRVYIVFTVKEIMELIGCSENKEGRLLGELDDIKGVGLIEKKRRGLGKPNIIYVKNFLDKEKPGPERKNTETLPGFSAMRTDCVQNKIFDIAGDNKDLNIETVLGFSTEQARISQNNVSDTVGNEVQESSKQQFKNRHNGSHRTADIEALEPPKSQSNNTDINKTDFNKTYLSSIHHDTAADMAEKKARGIELIYDMCLYKNIIKMNIDYDILVKDRPFDKDRIDGFVELMTEVCCKKGTVRVNHEDIPAVIVKNRFLELNGEHIRYVLDCLDKNTSLIGNIRAYIISALFNAPVTISQYYQSLANHDIAKMS